MTDKYQQYGLMPSRRNTPRYSITSTVRENDFKKLIAYCYKERTTISSVIREGLRKQKII